MKIIKLKTRKLLDEFDNLIFLLKDALPYGIKYFRIFNKIGTAFEKALKTNVLELEKDSYNLLSSLLKKVKTKTPEMENFLRCA